MLDFFSGLCIGDDDEYDDSDDETESDNEPAETEHDELWPHFNNLIEENYFLHMELLCKVSRCLSEKCIIYEFCNKIKINTFKFGQQLSSKSLISIDPHNLNLHDWGTEERKRERIYK